MYKRVELDDYEAAKGLLFSKHGRALRQVTGCNLGINRDLI